MGKRGPKPERIVFMSAAFFRNAKIRALTDSEKVAWLTLVAAHVEQGNGSGEIPEHRYGVSVRRCQKYIQVGLLDENEGALCIHDWAEWNGRDAYKRFLNRERVRRHRAGAAGEM